MNLKTIWTARKASIGIGLSIFAANLLVDRITKLLAIEYLKDIQPLSFLWNTIILTYAENSGAFLSMGSQWPQFIKYTALLILPIAVCLYGIYWCLIKEKDKMRIILMMTILGGGLSNLVDRLVNDFHVTDFLNFGIGSIRTGVLNVADLSVTFGAIILLIHEFKRESQ